MIRPATFEPADLQSIERLLDYGVNHGRVLPRTPKEIEFLIGDGHLYLAECDGEIAGMVVLEVYSERLVEVRTLVVHPEYQSRRIGSLLVETCLAEARRLGAREVLAITDRVDFFERLGFRTCLDEQVPLFIKL